MNRVARLRLIGLLLAAGALALGYGLGEAWIGTALFGLLGVSGWLGLRKVSNLGSLLYLILMAGSVYGMFLGLSRLVMLIALVAALAFWDLDAFYVRLKWVNGNTHSQPLVRGHLRRLGWVLGLGFVLGLVGISFEINLTTEWGIVLGIITVVVILIALRPYQQGRQS
ncbi:MAG: hypothetical protein JW726_16615 [Anaerolineales bacterium]|nr:hypothetical protein [Anaerolineales bacterium]